MGKAYSIDLRGRVYSDVEKDVFRRAAARRFGISASTGVRVEQRMAATGSLEGVSVPYFPKVTVGKVVQYQ